MGVRAQVHILKGGIYGESFDWGKRIVPADAVEATETSGLPAEDASSKYWFFTANDNGGSGCIKAVQVQVYVDAGSLMVSQKDAAYDCSPECAAHLSFPTLQPTSPLERPIRSTRAA